MNNKLCISAQLKTFELILKGLVVFSMVLQFGCMHAAPAGSATSFVINHDRRTVGAIVDDNTIGVKANLALSKDKELWRRSHISTLIYNGVLLLVGQTPDESTKIRAEELLLDIPEIKKIHNQLTVEPIISLNRRMQDAWVTTQVKAKIFSSREVGPNRVKVITEDNKVYLMGQLTNDEAEIVENLARKVKDITEVVTIFDYKG